jgi:hypothetical protein
MFRMQRTRSRILATAVPVLVAALGLAGCGKDDKVNNPPNNPPAGSSTFDGTIVGNGVSGTLSITLATATPGPQFGAARVEVVATGRLVLLTGGGGTVDLTGTHDTATHVFSVAGGGWTFSGGTTSFGLEGGFSGPAGETGVFTLQTKGSGADTVVVVTGTFTSTTGGPGGVFNLAIRGTVIHGNAWENGDSTPIPLDGTFNPANGDISIVNPANPGGPPLATGNYDGTTGDASGSYDNGAGEAGNWAGTKQN